MANQCLSRCLLVAVFVALTLVGCRPAPATVATPLAPEVVTEAPPTAQPTQTPPPDAIVPSPTAPPATVAPPTAMPTVTPPPAAESTPTAVPEATYEGWGEYRNDSYGFAFRYPPGWVVEEDQPPSTMVNHGVWVRDPALPEVGLRVGFRRVGEEQQITPTGIGAGEIVPRGSTLLLGEALRRDVLVAQDKDMEVLYGGTGSIRRGDIELFLRLHCACSPADETTLSTEAQATADEIVASFRRTP